MLPVLPHARNSHQQIDAACAGFPDSAIVGRGGFGPVFKGRFMGKDVAVKRLDGYGLQGLPNFLREVQVRTSRCDTSRARNYGIKTSAWWGFRSLVDPRRRHVAPCPGRCGLGV